MPTDKPRVPFTDEPGLAGGPGPTPPGVSDQTPITVPATPETPEVPRPGGSGDANDAPQEGTPPRDPVRRPR